MFLDLAFWNICWISDLLKNTQMTQLGFRGGGRAGSLNVGGGQLVGRVIRVELEEGKKVMSDTRGETGRE